MDNGKQNEWDGEVSILKANRIAGAITGAGKQEEKDTVSSFSLSCRSICIIIRECMRHVPWSPVTYHLVIFTRLASAVAAADWPLPTAESTSFPSISLLALAHHRDFYLSKALFSLALMAA